jgi:methyl-accepting chemotaxis protein
VFLISLLAFIGYLYGVKRLTGFAAFIPMALHTAATFIVLSFGILFARPARGLMVRLTNESAGGAMVRRLLLLILGIPLALGWAILAGQRAGFYDAEFGFSVFVLVVIGVFSAIVWANAVSLDRKEGERRRAEGALREAHDELERRVQERTRDLANVLLEIREGVGVLGFSAGEILAANTQVASSAEETAAAVGETTATVEEVKQTVQLCSEKARRVSERSQQAAQVSRSGKRAVDDTIEGMSRIKHQMESIAESVVRLSERNLAIGGIIATVTNLAERTNLLAVNAAIEAAKAGEHGRGFVVVAQEVRSLAEQSKQATAQVRTILSDIHAATQTAVRAAEQGSKAVEAGTRQSNEAGESIQMLADSIVESAQAALQIAASSRQQVVGMNQVTLAMESIKQASTQNVGNTKHAETSARDVHELGQKLKQLVERYEV